MNAIVIVSINLNNCQERSSLSESCRINAQKYAGVLTGDFLKSIRL